MIVDFTSYAQERAEAMDARAAYMASRGLPATRCTSDCNQGRRCTCAPMPAEACSEFLSDGVDPTAAAAFWTYYIAGIAVVAVALLAALLPA